MSKIILPKEIPQLLKEKVRLQKMYVYYLNKYKTNGTHSEIIRNISKRVKEINDKLGIKYIRKIDGAKPLIKKAVGLTG